MHSYVNDATYIQFVVDLFEMNYEISIKTWFYSQQDNSIHKKYTENEECNANSWNYNHNGWTRKLIKILSGESAVAGMIDW